MSLGTHRGWFQRNSRVRSGKDRGGHDLEGEVREGDSIVSVSIEPLNKLIAAASPPLTELYLHEGL